MTTLNELLLPLRGTLGRDFGLDDYLEALLIDYLNLAQEDLLNTLPPDCFPNLTYEWSITSVSGTLNVAIPTSPAVHRMINLVSNSKPATMIDAKQYQYIVANLPTAYATNASERPMWAVFNNKIYVYPDPAASTVGFYKLYGVKKPTRMVQNSDSSDIPQEYVNGQVMNATIRALLSRPGKGAEAGALDAKYKEWVGAVTNSMGMAHKIPSNQGLSAVG